MDDPAQKLADESGGSGANWPLASMLDQLLALEGELAAAKHVVAEARQQERLITDRIAGQRDRIAALMREAGVGGDNVNGTKVSIVAAPVRLVRTADVFAEEFYDLVPSLNEARIKARLMSGMEVEGARLERRETLRIEWRKTP